jgi:hypothetical protein
MVVMANFKELITTCLSSLTKNASNRDKKKYHRQAEGTLLSFSKKLKLPELQASG